MTRTEPRRARIWLTPATAVVAVLLFAVYSVVAGQYLRRQLVGAPAAPAAAPTASSSPKPTYTIAGKLKLPAGQFVDQGHACRGSNADAQVVVTDKTGASLTYAALRPGSTVDGACELPFTLHVPAGEGSYALDVPHWGATTYTEAELADMLELTFG